MSNTDAAAATLSDTEPSAEAFAGPHWTPELVAELREAAHNGRVGSRIVSESERVRVWRLELKPGERLPFHTHVMDYFWTATSDGRALSRHADGHVAEVEYAEGDTEHYAFGKGESKVHDLENVGDTVLSFTTVEFFGGPNRPLL